MHSSSSATTTIIILIISIAISTCSSQDDDQYYNCISNVFSCGQNIKNITYPFWGDDRPSFCGHPAFQLKCQNNEFPILDINQRGFRVHGIDQSNHLMTIASSDIWDSYCTQELHNITLDFSIFNYGPTNRDLFIFYNCTPEITRVFPNNFTCELGETDQYYGFYADESFLRVQLENSLLSTVSCNKSVEVPVFRVTLDELSNGSSTLQQGLNRGFELIYDADNEACSRCVGSGGLCGSNSSSGFGFVCHCRDRTDPRTCRSSGDEWNVGRKIGIGFGASGFTLLVISGVIFLYKHRNKKRYGTSSWVSGKTTSYPSSMADLEQPGAFYGVHIFRYNELEKATSNFDSKKELGDGGFGTVYQGKLKDGRVVAVKRLYEHNYKRVEQFMNEVEILARLRHQNLVSLYGCTSRHCHELLLVYEYISNGTVADHLHGGRAKPGSVSWTTRMSIAVETASALAYLHASDIIHRDVKTNNILLDSNFCVKVADFGLSRLFPTDVTHVSTAPQGTPGYVDPEYHECYHLTDKSDVYSFGVVLIELISSKPAVDIMRHRHEINLSTMAINKIQNNTLHELVDSGLGFESDYKVREMITEVAELAFQCLQNERDMRPSMGNVLETLKGIQNEDWNLMKAEEVEIPADEVVLLNSDPPTLTDSVGESRDEQRN